MTFSVVPVPFFCMCASSCAFIKTSASAAAAAAAAEEAEAAAATNDASVPPDDYETGLPAIAINQSGKNKIK